MNRPVIFALALLGCSSGAAAQIYIADPLDNLTPTASNTGNVIPLGLSGTNFDESRVHYFFPAAYLPGTGGVITAIEVSAQFTATTPYQLLEISMDHTTNAGLSTTFANNLTAPQIVYSIASTSINWPNGPYTIQLQTPFQYDGTSNLVIETRKIIDRPLSPTALSSTRVLVWPQRTDTVPPVWAFGSYGTGQSSAATASTVFGSEVFMRLHFARGSTLTINSTRNTVGNSNRGFFHIGATVTLANHGTPAAAYATFFEVTLFPAGISIPGIGGELWITSFTYLIDSGALDGAGQSSFAAAIPSDPTLVGLQAHFQSIVLGGAGVEFTNIVKAPVAAF